MVQTTSPDLINKWTNGDPTSIVQASQSQGDSVQAAFSKRERYTYVWPTVTERNAETGMVLSSLGYQIDTKSEYKYDGSAWKLATPYAEFTASLSMATGSGMAIGALSIDGTNSTDTTFVTAGASGILTLVNPGIYSVYSVTDLGSNLSLSGSLDLVRGSTWANNSSVILHRASMPQGEFLSGNTAPCLITTTSNSTIGFFANKQTAANPSTVVTRVRIARIG